MFRSFRSILGVGAKRKSVTKNNQLWNRFCLNVEKLEERAVPANFTTGNLAVLLADGVTSAATAVHIAEYSTTGTLVQTVDLPTTAVAAPGNGAVTQGSSTTEGFLSRTQDKKYLLATGYNATSGTAGVVAASVDRVVARIAVDTTIDSTTRVPGLPGANIRSAASKDGGTIYVTGSNGTNGLQSLAFGTQPTTPNVITALNSRQAGVFGDTLFDSASSGSNVGGNLIGVAGTLPTTTATATLIGGTANAMGIYGLDRDASVPGIDEVFVADPSNGLRKFSFNGTTWTLQGTLTGTGNFFSVVLVPNGSGTDIYATTGTGAANGNNLVKYTDSAAYNATASFSTVTTLATAAAGHSFRGVALTPEPGLPASTTTVVGSPASPQNQGTSVTFTATVSGSPSDGTVTFYAGPGLTNQIGSPVNVVSGSATSAATTTLPGGVNTISAVYSGGASFDGSTGTTSYSINASTTTSVVGSPPSPQTVGTSVSFTATISGSPSVGNVTFYAGPGLTNQIGAPVNVVSGSATSASTTTLPVGTNTISAVYSGGALFQGSTGTTPYTISPVALLPTSTFVLGSPLGAQPYGTQITFTATVTSSTTPTGTVNFSDGATLLGSGNLNAGGVASFTTITPLILGAHAISATYLGDATHNSSTGMFSQTINYAAGDLLVTRVGTGAALAATATASFLEDYTPAGTANTVNTVPLPVASGSALTLGGTVTTEGYLSLAADGHSVIVAGYNQVPGSATTSANRVIGVVSPSGVIDISTQMPSATNAVRAATSVDGLGFWIASTTGLRYVPFGNAAATASTQVSSFYGTLNSVVIGPTGQLYMDAGAGANSNTGVPAIDGPATIGVGLPMTAGQTPGILPGFPTASVGSPASFPLPNQFAISPDGHTIFLADGRTNSNGGLLEFTDLIISGQWTNVLGNNGAFPIGTPGTDSGLRAISVDFTDSANPIVYATTTNSSANRIVKITGGTTDGNTPSFVATVLSTAPANEAYRGVSFVPKPAGATTSSTSLAVTNSPADYGTGVTLTATVTAGATGWVSFRNAGVEIGAAPIDVGSGTAVYVTRGNLPAGTYTTSIVAVYTGDSTYAPSTSSAGSATINQAATSTAIAVSPSSAAAGANLTLTATITVPAGTSPGGTVTFKDGTTVLNSTAATISQVIVGGAIQFQATFVATFATNGTHNITAEYSGDANFLPSISPSTPVFIVGPSTTVVTTSAPNPDATVNAPVTLTATVSGTAGTPTGSVQFYDNLLPIGGPVTLAGTVANTAAASVMVTTSLTQSGTQLTPGLHSITAIYTPDAASVPIYAASTGVYQQAVKGQAFGASDQFVYRVGDGTTSLNPTPTGTISNGSTIFVDEYTPAGTLVQSLILPSNDGTGSQSAIRAVVGNGAISSAGQLSLSGDGRYLFLVGYDFNPMNGVSTVDIRGTTTSRAVARIKFDGTIQTEAFVNGVGGVETGGTITGVYSPDGNQFYVSGFDGVYYFSSFTPSASLQSATAFTTANAFTVIGLGNNGGNLIAVGEATTAPSKLIQQYTGFPTTASVTPSALNGVDNTTSSLNDLHTIDAYFTHLNGGPAGINTFYMSNDGPGFANGKITKWALVGATWNLVDTITAGTGNTALTFYYLSGVVDGSGNLTLYSGYGGGANNSGPAFLYSVVDNNGYNHPIGTGGSHSDAVTTVATVASGGKENFRGVASAPHIVATTTTLTATPNASTGGTLVTFTATIAPSPGALGTVDFKDGMTTIASGVAVAGGIATFQTSSLSVATHPITAFYSGDSTAGFTASTSNTLNYVVSPPAGTQPVATVTLNAGLNATNFPAGQHSRMINVQVTFDQAVLFDPTALSLVLHGTVVVNGTPVPVTYGGTPGNPGAIPASLNVAESADHKTWTMTFSGANTAPLAASSDGLVSLVDGVYDFKIDPTKVIASVGGLTMTNANTSTTFHRLFGDVDNPAPTPSSPPGFTNYSALVTSNDNLALRNAFNTLTGDPAYRAYLDVDGDGQITSNDNLALRNRFNIPLNWAV